MSKPEPIPYQKALEVKLPDAWSRAAATFDDVNLVSHAGLAPVLALAERAGLSELIGEKVRIWASATKVKSAGVNPAGKLTSIIAGMAAGADCIDDLDVIRSGGMKQLFGGVYAATTLGQFLREFTHGHTLQLASVLRAHLVNLREHSSLLPGIEARALIDIDSLLRPVFGHAKQGASFGHTKIAGKQVLRRGLSPLVTTISTEHGAPVIAGIRLRAGKAGSGKGRSVDDRRGDPHRPRRRRRRGDPRARRLGLRQQPRRQRLRPRGCAVLRRPGEEPFGGGGDREDPRRRVGPGQLPRCRR